MGYLGFILGIKFFFIVIFEEYVMLDLFRVMFCGVSVFFFVISKNSNFVLTFMWC